MGLAADLDRMNAAAPSIATSDTVAALGAFLGAYQNYRPHNYSNIKSVRCNFESFPGTRSLSTNLNFIASTVAAAPSGVRCCLGPCRAGGARHGLTAHCGAASHKAVDRRA